MLHHEVHYPPDAADGAQTVVLLHGRGADANDLAGLGPHLAPDAVVVLPRGPFPGAPWGYGPGWAWYRFLAEDRPDVETFRAAQRALGEFLTALPELLAIRPGELVLGGFSQGGTMSLAYALANPGTVARVLNFSGFLANHPDVKLESVAAGGTRYFWGHGTQDPAIPFELAVRGRAALRAAGADLTARDYPIGHWITPEELHDASEWLVS